MKTNTLLTVIILFISLGLYSQSKQEYYVEVKTGHSISPTEKTINSDGTLSLIFANTELQNFFDSKQIYKYKLAFPGAITPSLQRVYSVILNSSSHFDGLINLNDVENVEIVPETIPIFDPNDYVETTTGNNFSTKEQLDLIHASETWDITTGLDVIVGIADENYTEHDDLTNNILFYEGGGGSSIWHGDFVIGSTAAETNNNIGVASIGYNTKIVVLDIIGTGVDNVWELYQMALNEEYDIKIINCSFISSCTPSTYHQGVFDEINDFGITVVCGAGNGSVGNHCGGSEFHNYVYPASYDSTISVSGVGHKFIIGSEPYGEHNRHNWKDVHEFRLTEPIECHTHNDKVDLCAPAYDVTSTSFNNTYAESSGTSFASPMVAGVVSLMLSVNPNLTPNEVKEILRNTTDYIYDIPENEPYIGLLGTGRVNAYRAVKTAKCMYGSYEADPELDLFTRNTNNDLGNEPYEGSENMWNSTDIWVRNNQDGLINPEHQNPEYNADGSPNYICVRVRNTSCATSSGNETVTVNWAKASTALAWPENWDGTLSDLDGDPLGGEIPFIGNIPVLQPGQEAIIEIPWVVPNPENYFDNASPHHFCLISRIDATDDPLTSPMTSNPNIMVRENNNLAWKNLSIVDLIDDIGASVIIANPSNISRAFFLELYKETSDNDGKAIYEEGEVVLQMDDVLFNAWERGGKQAELLEAKGDEKKNLVKGDNVKVDNILFEPNEIGLLTLNFNFLITEITDKIEYTYHVVQKDANTGEVIGGETFLIRKSTRDDFLADAGNDKEIYKNDSVTISAEEINEAAVYNWYDEDGNLIYTGKDLTVTPDVTKKYKLEVITDKDGYKDYDEIEVKVNPYSIQSLSPNPTSDYVNIEYKAEGSISAYFMITSTVNGESNNYILNSNEFETTIDVSSYSQGIYSIALVCDGEIVDAKNLIID